MSTRYEHFTKIVDKTNDWLAELQADLGWSDRHQAYLAFRAVLHALRDRLSVGEIAQLGAQLPMLVRGFYYEGWSPRQRSGQERRLEHFFERVERELTDGSAGDVEAVVRAVFRLLDNRVSVGEIEDVKSLLPREIRDLWPAYNQPRA